MADLKGWSVLVVGVRTVQGDPGKLLDGMRAKNPDVFVQAADAQAVYGMEHVMGVLQIALEAYSRGILIADRVETEVLLRLACTGQISAALKKAGLKSGRAGCFIAFSKDAQALKSFGGQLAAFELDDSVIKASKEKIAPGKAKGKTLDYLLEQAAILVKS